MSLQYFIEFCIKHGGYLKNHRDFGDMARELTNKEDDLRKEMTRLLLGISPNVEPEKDITDLFWQLDNAVAGLKQKTRNI